MTGSAKAIVIIALAVVAVVAFNVALWRRMRVVLTERAAWSAADFDAALASLGYDGTTAAVVRDLVAPCYAADVAPRPEDGLCVRADGLVEEGCRRLGIPTSSSHDGERIRSLETVGDLAGYLDARRGGLQPPR